MTDILTRLRDATPNDECLIMRDVINFACEKSWISNVERVQALRLVAVGAFVDAALTLVPEGWRWQIHSHQPGFTVVVRSPDAKYQTPEYPSQGGTYEAHLVEGMDASAIQTATPALALCIAALKARMAKEDAA